MAGDLPFPWDTFLELQQITDTSRISARAHAADEALTSLIDEWSKGRAPATREALTQRFWILVGNRSKKYRSRAKAEDQVLQYELSLHLTADSYELATYRELATRALDEIGPSENKLLVNVFGDGLSYREVAAKLGKPVGTVKALVSRVRKRVCNSANGCIVLRVLKAA